MAFAIAYTKPGTTLTFWLNRHWSGWVIWSLVRTQEKDRCSDQRWTQPALRFGSEAEAQAFIAKELANNKDARVMQVDD
jgi:hypothetical protein